MQPESDPKRNRDEADDGGPEDHLKCSRHIAVMHSCDNDGKYRGWHGGLNNQDRFKGYVEWRNFRKKQDEARKNADADRG